MRFESSLGNVQVGESQQPMKKYVVSSEGTMADGQSLQSNEFSALQSEISEARREKIKSQTIINPAAKKRLEVLSGLGRATKDVPIDGVVFSIRTLKGGELREIVRVTTQSNEAVFDARAQTLARVIYKIDGQDINLVLGDDSLETKLLFIENLDEEAIQYIYKEYTGLVNSHKKKYASVEEEVKEISNDLNKSS